MDIQKIKNLMLAWRRQSYNNGLPTQKQLNPIVLEKTHEMFRLIDIEDKPMDGNSVQRLDDDGERDNQVAEIDTFVMFNEVFDNMINGENFFSPAYYVYRLVEKCCDGRDDNMANDDFDTLVQGTIRRGLRTLASFFREMDLANKIINNIPEAGIERNPVIDTNEHTDVLVTYHNRQYRLWSYLTTQRGLYYGARRLRNEGGVPSGTHILCPLGFNREDHEYHAGWWFYLDRDIETIAALITQDIPDDTGTYADMVENRSYEEVKNYMKNIHMFIKEG